jgi:hypothetical protein
VLCVAEEERKKEEKKKSKESKRNKSHCSKEKMTRGRQKLEAQQKNREKLEKQKKGGSQLGEARNNAFHFQCHVCKSPLVSEKILRDHYENRYVCVSVISPPNLPLFNQLGVSNSLKILIAECFSFSFFPGILEL